MRMRGVEGEWRVAKSPILNNHNNFKQVTKERV